MAGEINANDSRIIIDQEVGSGGSYSINGHNNAMRLKRASCAKVVIMGHNNELNGTQHGESIDKLVVLGHNNVIKDLEIGTLEVLGHNNVFKRLTWMKEPANSGYENKYYDVQVWGGDTDACYESSSDSSDSSEDEGGYTETQTFKFNTNMGGDVHDIMMNIQSQVGDMLNGINLGSNFNIQYEANSEDSDEESEEEKHGDYHEEEEEDPEADISPEERAEIINSINSFSYTATGEDENCAVCLSKLEDGQQVKKLMCSHTFHPKWINSWLKQRLLCPCCKAAVE